MNLNNTVINKVSEDRCTSCFACYNICPNNAIEMKLSSQGFYKPQLDASKCNNCGICSTKCPVLVNTTQNRTADSILCYGGWTKEETLHRNSSSGGIFTEIANIILDSGGIVYGVSWQSDWTLAHQKAVSRMDIIPFQGSKYLQSNIGLKYKEIAQLIEEGKTVLFPGLPCQIAALRNFVRSDKLITIDFVCHGTPSQLVFHKYLENIRNNRVVKSIDFRSKQNGWSKFQTMISYTDGTTYSNNFREDPFMIGFLSDLYLNTSCYNCSFCSVPRQGDITLADYWGIPKEYKHELGVSLILSNNEKGDSIIKAIRNKNCTQFIQMPFESAIKGNPRIIDGTLKIPMQRDLCLNNIQSSEFDAILNIIEESNCFKPKNKIVQK